VRLSRTAVAALPRAVQSIVLREAMRRARGDLQGIARAHVAAARRLIAGEPKCGELHLPRLRVLASPSTIEFAAWSRQEASDAWLVPLVLGRTTVQEPGVVVELSLLSRDEVSGVVGPWSEVADADSVRFPLVARGRRAGDRFAPLGMGKDVRLKSFLINARVPLERRDRLLLVCDQEKVVWVAGVRLSDAVRLRESTRRVLVMRAEEVDR
jgi:tRNA(Ile)-lysidine synthase